MKNTLLMIFLTLMFGCNQNGSAVVACHRIPAEIAYTTVTDFKPFLVDCQTDEPLDLTAFKAARKRLSPQPLPSGVAEFGY